MRTPPLVTLVLLALSCPLPGTTPPPVPHSTFQAVHSDGSSAFDDAGPFLVALEGILLNNPEDWLDPTPDPTVAPWFMGGQWEIFIQGEGDDHAGTACWMGQNYANGPGDSSYTNQQWLIELCWLNHDPNSDYPFRAGDRIRVTGTYLFYAGKLNINENHETDPLFDFKVELVKSAVGLPQPEGITLSDLKHPDDTDIFDATRMNGGEYYQARRVRINDVTITDPQNWGVGNTVTVSDGQGRTFPVYLARGVDCDRHTCPTGLIDVIGILDQKSPGYPPDPTTGYRLLVLNHDGNRRVLGSAAPVRGDLNGDINHDYVVNLTDLAALAQDWLRTFPGLCNCTQ